MEEKVIKRGFIQVYTGDGKGKTTSALGLALRASGYGFKSAIVQFMKGSYNYGEIYAIEKIPEISIFSYGRVDLVRKGDEKEIDFQEAQKAMAKARELMKDPSLSILILDEVNVAVFFGFVKEEDLLSLIDEKPSHLELILTGRKATQRVMEKAHLVTEMREIKHYYKDMGLLARKGIEY